MSKITILGEAQITAVKTLIARLCAQARPRVL
jgi:hypothetical protein